MPLTTRPLIAAALALAGLLAVAPALSQVGPRVHLEGLTWTEVRDRVSAGATTVIVPVGGTEQNGPAMALGKHNVRVRLLAGRIAESLGNTLVAPVIAYVPEGAVQPASGHMRFAGTITIPEPVFEATLEYAARSLRQHGFRNVVFIGDHGGYQKNMVRVAARLNREWGAGPARVHAVVEYYRALDEGFAQALRQRGHGEAEIGLHAGLADTSLTMALDAGLVRAELLHGRRFGPGDGVRGDPSRASAELGQLGVEMIVSTTTDAIRRKLARD